MKKKTLTLQVVLFFFFHFKFHKKIFKKKKTTLSKPFVLIWIWASFKNSFVEIGCGCVCVGGGGFAAAAVSLRLQYCKYIAVQISIARVCNVDDANNNCARAGEGGGGERRREWEIPKRLSLHLQSIRVLDSLARWGPTQEDYT